MSRLGFDLCEDCDRLWNEGGGHDTKTCPGCDLTTAIQERYKAEEALRLLESDSNRHRAALADIWALANKSPPGSGDYVPPQYRRAQDRIRNILADHQIDPEKLGRDHG